MLQEPAQALLTADVGDTDLIRINAGPNPGPAAVRRPQEQFIVPSLVRPLRQVIGQVLAAQILEVAQAEHQKVIEAQEQLRREYDEFQRAQPLTLSVDQRSLIRHLAEDVPTLWASPATTPQDRQQIVRMLVERIELNITGDTEQTEITITWAGGLTSSHRLSRTVISYSQRSDLDQLIARMTQLRQAGLTLKQVAKQLNQAGVPSIRGRPFTNYMVSKLLVQRGLHFPVPENVPSRSYSANTNGGPRIWLKR